MYKLKTNIFLTLLVIMLPLLGMAQTLTLTADNNLVCFGDTVVFSTHISGSFIGEINWHALYKNNVEVERQLTSNNETSFYVDADETAVYKAIVHIGDNTKDNVESDSIVLTVNMPTTEIFVQSSCDVFKWHNVFYYESGTYHFDTINSNGCLHTDTLHLTINRSTESFDTIIACGQYEWKGTVYYQSGDYPFDTINALGCDSIMHLHLTINEIPDIMLNGDEMVCDNSEVEYTVTTPNDTDMLYQWQVIGGTLARSDTTETIIVKWNQDMSEGLVSVEVTDKNTGCSAVASQNIIIQTLIDAALNTIEAKKNTSGIPYILVYPNPEPSYQYYQWYKYDEPIEGANRQYLHLKGNTLTEIDSIYRVYVATYSDGNTLVCGKFSEYYVGNPFSSGKMMTISPNPVDGSPTINIYLENASDHAFVKIYSPDGRIVFGDKASGNPIKIAADFPKGVYVVEITDNEGNKYFEKVIIK